MTVDRLHQGPATNPHKGMLRIIMTGSLKAGYSPVLRRLNANGGIEINLGFRSTVSVH
jgi:hypothetical protein